MTVIFYMLMILIRSRLQGRELKPFICTQVQDHLQFIDFKSNRDASVRYLYVRSFFYTYTYSRNDHKINFRMVSVQHFINEALDVAKVQQNLIVGEFQSSWKYKVRRGELSSHL